MVPVLIILLVGFIVIHKLNYDEEAIFMIAFMSFLLIFTLFVASLKITEYNGVMSPGKYYIKAMNDTSVINGKFFLASGALSENSVYKCYIKNEKDSNVYGLYRFSADPTISKVHEENIDNPYVLVKSKEAGSWIWLLGKGEVLVGYEFHIPVGSIVDETQLDLK
jgi:hypothetical protein